MNRTPSAAALGPRMMILAALACVALSFYSASAGSPPVRIEPGYQKVVDGLEYAHLQTTNWNSGEPWSIHIAKLDRSRRDLSVASTLARGEVFGIAPVSAIAKAFPQEKGEALVMINAGFCIRTKHPYMGAPKGLVVTDREVVSGPGLVARDYCFWVDERGGMQFGKYKSNFEAVLPDGSAVPIRLNFECNSNSVVLFTHMLGKSTRATNNFELILERSDKRPLSWRLGENSTMTIKAVNPEGNTPLSNTIAVLSFGPDAAPVKVSPGDSIKLALTTAPELKDIVTACHAIFPVVEKDRPLETFDATGVILRRNPRTAIGYNDLHFYMVVVDGRKKELSMGMDARELAQFMHLLGCKEAINLDGGGSSTFWMTGSTRNTVVGSRERDRADALVITRRAATLARQ